MSAAHTPGPWTVRSGETLNGYTAQYIEPNIADVFYANEVGKANARLIAAAPDMLLALRRAALALAFVAESSKAMQDDYEAVSAAIRKAVQT